MKLLRHVIFAACILAVSAARADEGHVVNSKSNTAVTQATSAPAKETAKEDEVAYHVRAAQAAEAKYHEMCDRWAFENQRDEDTASTEKRMREADAEFRRHVMRLFELRRYIPNAAVFTPQVVLGAGKYGDKDGKAWSYLIGADGQAIAVWMWERAEWTATRLPAQGYGGSLSVAKEHEVAKMEFGKAKKAGEGSKIVFSVPYSLEQKNGDKISGVITISLAEHKVQPDRGVVVPMNVWHPGK